MLTADVIVAGGGISGLLIASALSPHCSVILLEQGERIPKNKYWLTTERVVDRNQEFAHCIDRRYDFMDFVAHDGSSARVDGRYCLWDTPRVIDYLEAELDRLGVKILTGHRLYSFSSSRNEINVRANDETIKARLLVDCMGFGSPLVGAYDVAKITGYYIVHGREVAITHDVPPIALDNVVIGRAPAYFELFPTSYGTAHAALILPARHHKPEISLARELSFILESSHYRTCIDLQKSPATSYFGIVPVGRLRKTAIDRVAFFGEAAQANPAASATALTRMLDTYKGVAAGLVSCLNTERLDEKNLKEAMPVSMSRMNRVFQETLFESLLTFNSNDFLRLVEDMRDYPNTLTSDLIFADFDFSTAKTARLALDALLRPRGVLGRHMIKAFRRFLGLK
jgi:2-polyprenyl-6-methoxyphenol hydroxylase-like FAD-dependent oxidoreductase